VETTPQEAHSGKETYFDLTCSSTVLTVQPITLFVMENIQPWGSPQFLHHTSQRGFATYGLPHLSVRLESGLWVGLGLGLQLELLMAFVVWCEKCTAKKVLVSVLAILFNSSNGIGIGNTFCQSTGIGNTFHKYC